MGHVLRLDCYMLGLGFRAQGLGLRVWLYDVGLRV